MGERFEYEGVIYEDLGDGNVRVIGPATQQAPQQGPQSVVIGAAPRTQPDIRTIGDTIVSVDPSSGGVTPLYTAPEGRDTKAEAEAGVAATMREGTLRALRLQIDRVRDLYRRNFQGGAPNALVNLLPNFVYPALGEFQSAGAGLADTGNAAFRTPGTGPATDADAERFVAANTPQPGDSDAQIEQKLMNLETRLNEQVRAMGQDPAAWAAQVRQTAQQPAQQGQQRDQQAPATVPVGGQGGGSGTPPSGPTGGSDGGLQLGRAQPGRPGPNGGVTAAGGPNALMTIPGNETLGQELRQLVTAGASRRQIIAHYRARRMEAGYPPDPAQERVLEYAASGGTVQGWENFGQYAGPQQADPIRSAIGRAADTNIGAAAISAGNAASFGALRNVSDNAGALLDAQRNERPISALVGDLGGSVVAMSGVNRLGGALLNTGGRLAPLAGRALTGGGGIGGDALYGSVRGAAEADPGNRLQGALYGGALGAGGNFLGSRITSGAGAIATGVQNDAVRYLTERGIRLTPGQTLGQSGMFGRGVRGFENALESIPIIGQTIAQRRADGVDDYFRARVNDVLEPIGAQAQGNVGQEMLANARDAISNAYGVLDNRTFQVDPPAISEIGAAMQAGRSVPRVGDEFGAVMDRNVGPNFGPQGQITGRGLQDAFQQLRKARTEFGQDGSMGSMAADAFGNIDTSLTDMVGRQAPDVMPQLDAANRSYSGLVPLQNAQISAINQGVPTPAQVRRAATTNTIRFGGRARAAEGDYLGARLDEAAQQVMPSIINNSGTADRGLAALALPTALGGAAVGTGTISDDPTTAGLLATLAALSTRQGNRLIQTALVSRPNAVRAAGRAIQAQRRRGGMFGAALPSSYVPMLTAEQ